MPTKPVSLTKESAVVHTASIDVRIMRLDRRQVTMSVFRQLDEEQVIDNGYLLGDVWGRVNYVWKSGRREAVKFWVVWTDGKLIKRSPVYEDFSDMVMECAGIRLTTVYGTAIELDECDAEIVDRIYKLKEEFAELDQLFIAT